MKATEFRLARVLRVRAIQEEIARGHWQAAELKARTAQGAEDSLRAGEAQALSELGSRLQELAPHEVLLAHQNLDRLAAERRAAKERAHTLSLQADQARGPWESARRRLKGLERLAERSADENRRESLKREAAELDEAARVASTRSTTRRVVRPPTRPSRGQQS